MVIFPAVGQYYYMTRLELLTKYRQKFSSSKYYWPALKFCQNSISDAEHMAVELDVCDSTAVRNLLQTTLKQYKAPPTIVVNSAGITRDNWLLKMSEEDYDSVVNTNLKVRN